MIPLLLLSPYFPPMGVSGAKRALHLARNLPAAGYQPVVLASEPVNEPRDEALAAYIPAETVVSYGFSGRLRPWLAKLGAKLAPKAKDPRAVPKAPGRVQGKSLLGQDLTFLTPFDRFALDIPAGLAAARALIKQHDLKLIHVSADPWSPLIAALSLHRETGLPLVVDFRDPWSQHEAKMALRPRLAQRWLKSFERTLFEAASAVVLNTEAARDAYVASYRGVIPEARFHAIRNAFDLGLFKAAPPKTYPAFSVLYFGRFRQFVAPDALLEGFARLVTTRGLTPKDIELRVVGGLAPAHVAKVEALGLTPYVAVDKAVAFADSLPVLAGADVLALVIEPDSHLQIPGKLYDYLAAGKPILAVSANPEADRIVLSAGGQVARHGDAADVAEKLAALYERGQGAPVDQARFAPYSAKAQAERFAALYDEILSR